MSTTATQPLGGTHGLVIDWTEETVACACGWTPRAPLVDYDQNAQYDEHLAEAAILAMQERQSKRRDPVPVAG